MIFGENRLSVAERRPECGDRRPSTVFACPSEKSYALWTCDSACCIGAFQDFERKDIMRMKLASLFLIFCSVPALASEIKFHCAQEKGSEMNMMIDGSVSSVPTQPDLINMKGTAIVTTSTAPWDFSDSLSIEGVYNDGSDFETLWFRTTADRGNRYNDVIFALTFRVTDPNQMDVQNTGVVQPRFYVPGVFLNCYKK
jgi:hypothetical protein